MTRAWLVLLFFVLLSACANSPQITPLPTATTATWTNTPNATATPTSTPPVSFTPTWTPMSAPTVTLTPTWTPTSAPLARFKVLSYNILYGAGVERQWDSGVLPNLVGKNRLPDLIATVKAANPDIWGIQEATGWDRGSPPVIQQVAQQLGMNFFLATTPSGFHLGLLTKFEILETENLAVEVGRQGVLRAKLLSPEGKTLNVFIVHLDPAFADTRLCEVNTLIQKMQPYSQQWTILMGDMNFRQPSREYQRLEQAGWKPMAVEPDWGIDQIWVLSSMPWTNTTWFQSLPTPSDISDHNPIGAELAIYPTTATPPAATPFPPTPMTSVPTFVADTLTNVRVLRFDGLDDPCAVSHWTSRWLTEKISNGVLEIIGEESWQALASRYQEFLEGQGVLVRFQFVRGSEFQFYFDNPAWSTEAYRRFGFNVSGNRARAIMLPGPPYGRGENLSDDLNFAPDTWYTLLLGLGKNGERIAQVWDPAEPTRIVQYHEQPGALSPGQTWILRIGTNKGKVLVDSVTEISFSAIK